VDTHRFRDLAYREIGAGRPLILLHGFTGDSTQWIEGGPARLFADHGFRVILPDLRGHGQSARAGYRPDVLADDGLALVEQFDEYDLGGCSIGGRVVLRMLARGARPGRAIVAGQGLTAVTAPRANGLRDVLTALVNGDPPPDAQAAYWIKQGGNDPGALLRILDTHVPTSADALRQITTPTLVMIGDQDTANADDLAEALPNGQFVRVPGNHYTSLGSSEFASAALDFLKARGNATHASTTR
jgi:pimeloyl-ACP methyl ester carboxylesterase